MTRENQFKVLLSDDEKKWLEGLAESRGLSASDVIRLYIRESYDAELRPMKRGSHGKAR